MGLGTGELVIAAARTVSNYDDSMGVAAISMPFGAMTKYILQANEDTYGTSFIVQADGDIIFHHDSEFAPRLNEEYFLNIRDINGGAYAEIFNTVVEHGMYSGDGWLYVGAQMQHTGWFVITQVPLLYIVDSTMPTVYSLVATTLFTLALFLGSLQMIRRAKQAMIAEKESGETQRIFIESAPFIMNIWDENMELVATSEYAAKMFGFADKDDYIEHFAELSPERQPCGGVSADMVHNNLTTVFETGETLNIEWIHQTLDGKPVPVEVTLVRFERGDKYMIAAYTQDLRAIKEVIAKEQEANELNKIFLDSSPFAIDLWDDNYNVVDCNDQILRLFDLGSKQEYFDSFFKLSPKTQPCGTPSDEKAVMYMEEAFKTGHARFEFTHQKFDGEIIPTDITLVRIVRNGRPMLAGYIVDLRQIREMETRIQLMLDATPLAISMYDKEEAIIKANAYALQMFESPGEYALEGVASKTMPQFQPDGRSSEELLDQWIDTAFEEGFCYAEFDSMRYDGSVFPSEATWVRIKYQNRYVVVEYLRDLTVEKEAKERERRANELTTTIMDAAPMAIEMWDETGELAFANQRAMDISGVKTFEEYREMLGRFTSENIQPDGTLSATKLSQMMNLCLKDGFARFEWTHDNVWGETVPYDVQLVRIVRNGRNMVLGYAHDVRETKRAIAKMYEADERASLMMGAAPTSCFMMRQVMNEDKPKYEVIDLNNAALELFGFENHTEAHARFEEIFPDAGDGLNVHETIHTEASNAIASGYSRFEYTHRNMDGEFIPCEVTVVCVEYQGELSLTCFQTDLRPFMAALEKEQKSREMIQSFLDNAPMFVEVWDEHHNLLECNAAITEMFGIEDKDEYLLRYSEFNPTHQPCGTLSSEKTAAILDEAAEKGYAQYEWMHIDHEGNPLPVEATLVYLDRDEGGIIITYNQDLRQVKAAMEKEREARHLTQMFLDAAPLFI